jgi:hypothetical protein
MGGTAGIPFVDNSQSGSGDTGYESAAQTPVQMPVQTQAPTPAQPTQQTPATSGAVAPGGAAAGGAGGASVASKPATTAPEAPAPVVLEPQKATGLRGLMQNMADMLAGNTTRPELAKGSDGQTYVKQVDLTTGQKVWKAVGNIVHGAAAGLAAGKGAGNAVKAPLAGYNVGQADQKADQAQQQQMKDEAQKQNLAYANHQMTQMNLAEKGWELADKKVKATQEQVEFAQKEDDRLLAHGYVSLGTAAHAGDIGNVLHADPNLMENMIKNHVIEIRPTYDDQGNPTGVQAFKAPQNPQNTLLPAGYAFHTFNPITAQIEEHKSSDPGTLLQQNVYDATAVSEQMDYTAKKDAQAKSLAETAASNATVSKTPSEIEKNKAETAAAYGTAAKDRAAAAKDAAADPNSAEGAPLVDAIGTGKMTVDRLGYLAARNPALLEAVTTKYPDFDSSKAAQYPSVYKEFTSTKNGTAGQALNSGATALEHLKKLQDLNTAKSHIYGTPDYNAYHNQLDTLAPELAKFYGDTTVPAIAALKDTLGANLPGGRQAAIATQAQSMGKKFDNYEQTWRNAAPSDAYEKPMPGISEEAKEARAALDPQYKQRLVAEQQGQPTQPGAAKPAAASAPQFSPSAWKSANPSGDVNAAIAAAKKQGYTVVQ